MCTQIPTFNKTLILTVTTGQHVQSTGDRLVLSETTDVGEPVTLGSFCGILTLESNGFY